VFKFPFQNDWEIDNGFFNKPIMVHTILGDPGADSGGEGKSKWAEKYGTKEK